MKTWAGDYINVAAVWGLLSAVWRIHVLLVQALSCVYLLQMEQQRKRGRLPAQLKLQA